MNAAGDPADGVSGGAEISASGWYVAFRSDAEDLDTDSPGRGIFVRDIQNGTVERLPLDDELYLSM